MKAYLAVLLPLVLMLVLVAVLAWLAGGSGVFSGSGSEEAVAVNAIFSALGFLGVISLMIVQARLFMRIGDRVKGGAESARRMSARLESAMQERSGTVGWARTTDLLFHRQAL